MTTMAAELRPDFDDIAAELAAGKWFVYPYEAYGQLDRDEFNEQLVKHLAQRGVTADVVNVPKKSVTVVVNAHAIPTRDEVVESIAAIEHRRAMGQL